MKLLITIGTLRKIQTNENVWIKDIEMLVGSNFYDTSYCVIEINKSGTKVIKDIIKEREKKDE